MRWWLVGALALAACGTDGAVGPAKPSVPVDPGVDDDGSAAPTGSGRAFVVNHLVYPEGPGLNRFGPLMNDRIRQQLRGGESLIVLEVLGLDRAHLGLPDDVTVRTYVARDRDDPFFPANNFQTPLGDTTCCEFRVHAASPPDWRIPARIEGGRLTSRGTGASLAALLRVEYVPAARDPGLDGTDTSTEASTSTRAPSRPTPEYHAETLADASLSGRWSEHGLALSLEGNVPVGFLGKPHPYCGTLSDLGGLCVTGARTPWLYLAIALGLYPDVDRDGDGLERIEVDASGARCFDGCPAGASCSSFVPPMDTADPWSCTQSPRLADGIRARAELTAVPATIVGVTGSW